MLCMHSGSHLQQRVRSFKSSEKLDAEVPSCSRESPCTAARVGLIIGSRSATTRATLVVGQLTGRVFTI